MADIVIVTNRCYLICKAINYITIDDLDELDNTDNDPPKKITKAKSKKEKEFLKAQETYKAYLKKRNYQMVIDFIPSDGATNYMSSGGTLKQGQNSNQDSVRVSICIKGKDDAIATFHQIVDQIRHELPDQKYINDLVDKLLEDKKEDL